jgi:hypothetical protein
MTLLALRPYRSYPEGIEIPEDEIHDGMLREVYPNITQAEIVRHWDDRRENFTAWQLWRGKYMRCPKCKRGRAWRLINRDAVKCRWGHVTSRLEMIYAAQEHA